MGRGGREREGEGDGEVGRGGGKQAQLNCGTSAGRAEAWVGGACGSEVARGRCGAAARPTKINMR